MLANIVEYWLKTGKNALIGTISLKPIEHNLMKGKPLSSQKGQAEAFFMIDDKGNWWILKKFHSNCELNRNYLDKVGKILPQDDGFACGTKREVLCRGILQKAAGFHYNKDLDSWLDGTILMPRITGLDWASLADELRDGSIKLDPGQRFNICKNLTYLIELLEIFQCAHRDISCGNAFINTNTWQVSLIDFDSMYHPSLSMPKATTCGTTGYTTHLAWNHGSLDPKRTWCQKADRYALSLLNTEVLLVDRGMQYTGEGGIFDQEELRAQSGKGLNKILSELNAQYPLAAQLLDAAINCRDFSNCPSPLDWNSLYNTIPGLMIDPPSLSDFQDVSFEGIRKLLNQPRAAVPLWPAPSLDELSKAGLKIPEQPNINIHQIALPPDPWQNN